jgi:uncharacterized protein
MPTTSQNGRNNGMERCAVGAGRCLAVLATTTRAQKNEGLGVLRPSFDCRNLNAVEQAICNSSDLSKRDATMASLYQTVLARVADAEGRQAIVDAQRD